LEKGYISVIKQMYTLQVTDNKRKLVFKNNQFNFNLFLLTHKFILKLSILKSFSLINFS
jgi:hypothetical protein